MLKMAQQEMHIEGENIFFGKTSGNSGLLKCKVVSSIFEKFKFRLLFSLSVTKRNRNSYEQITFGYLPPSVIGVHQISHSLKLVWSSETGSTLQTGMHQCVKVVSSCTVDTEVYTVY
jgi:hypothetical protein